MKKLFVVFAMCFLSLPLFAQESPIWGEKGLDLQLRISEDVSVSKSCLSGYSMDFVVGYRFNRHFRLGGGLGLNSFDLVTSKEHGLEFTEAMTCVPLFADIKVNFTKTKVSPFFNAELGTILNGTVEGRSGGDIKVNPLGRFGFGIDINFDKGALFGQIDWKPIGFESDDSTFINTVDAEPWFVGLSVGYIFKR